MSKTLTHLKELEAESIYILREVAAQFERPCILFSGGKDSIVLTHLAWKAFWPAKIPFRLVHIDTGHNFPETLTYRDELVARLGADLTVGSVQESIDKGRVREETGYNASRNKLQTVTLLDTLAAGKFDAAIGGARRDEEKARAKERIFSHRDEFGQWNPKNQRPELWNIYNAKKDVGEHFRVFPISRASISGSSPSATGRKWMSGNISTRKESRCRRCTLRTAERSSSAMDSGWPPSPPSSPAGRKKKWSRWMCAAGPSAT